MKILNIKNFKRFWLLILFLLLTHSLILSSFRSNTQFANCFVKLKSEKWWKYFCQYFPYSFPSPKMQMVFQYDAVNFKWNFDAIWVFFFFGHSSIFFTIHQMHVNTAIIIITSEQAPPSTVGRNRGFRLKF